MWHHAAMTTKCVTALALVAFFIGVATTAFGTITIPVYGASSIIVMGSGAGIILMSFGIGHTVRRFHGA